jgi:putative exporter of polyketide antibiotics
MICNRVIVFLHIYKKIMYFICSRDEITLKLLLLLHLIVITTTTTAALDAAMHIHQSRLAIQVNVNSHATVRHIYS